MADSENQNLPPGEEPAAQPGTGEPQAPAPQPLDVSQPVVTAAGGADEAPPAEEATEGVARRRPPRQRHTRAWAAAAVVCAAAGVAATLIGSHALARHDAAETRASFRSSSAGTASTLRLAITHEEEILTSSGTFFSSHPNATPQQFAAWTRWARVERRHPELQRLTLIGLVQAATLPAFAEQLAGRTPRPPQPAKAAPKTATGSSAAAARARAATRPAPAKPAPPPFPLHPSGARPFYCLAVAELTTPPSHARAPGVDYCATHPELLGSRASGQTAFATSSIGGSPALTVTTPVYSGNPAPGSTGARSATFAGWVRELVLPGVMIQQALRGRPGEAVRLRHGSGPGSTVYASGTADTNGQSTSARLRSGWSARISGPAVQTAVLADRDSRWLLIGGLVLSALLGVLVFLLGTRRVPVPTLPRPTRNEDLYDPLTGLPNRALTLDRASRMVARASRQSGMLVGALLIDIDWFGDVNEKLGREAGDQLLCTVAERLEKVVRDNDSVGRLEGDEFVIVVEAAARGARLDALARRVIEALHKPVELQGFGPSFFLTASIGLAFGRYTSPDELLRDARLALQSAKTAGKDRYTLFNANMRAVIEDRGLLEAELNNALQEGQFFLVYQPIYDLSTHRVTAVEALIRWRHPKRERGILLPEDFIPLAEETGLIVPIGRWVLEEACMRAAAWNVAGKRVGVSVMITAHQLNREGLAVDVLRALQQSGLEPSLLTLEVAEATVMADVAATGQRLEELKRLGVSIAIDDFGSGYAYRADLQRMPLDLLKVDRRSLAASEDEDYRNWLLEAILVFARDLSLFVVAKGVETAEQLANLRAMGCAMAQGYFLGEPAPAEDVAGLLDSHLPAGGAAPQPAPQTENGIPPAPAAPLPAVQPQAGVPSVVQPQAGVPPVAQPQAGVPPVAQPQAGVPPVAQPQAGSASVTQPPADAQS